MQSDARRRRRVRSARARCSKGDGLPGRRTMRLVWDTSVGSRVSGDGFAPKESEIGDSHGRTPTDGSMRP